MNWQDVCERKELQDLPFKIELNQFGQIVMSPASNHHGYLQARISYLLLDQCSEGSRVISECSIDTADGVKVADVAWLSEIFWNQHGAQTPSPEAPELCVEIQSPSNSKGEMKFKRELYFQAGAAEVWICSESGQLSFYANGKSVKESQLFPSVPRTI